MKNKLLLLLSLIVFVGCKSNDPNSDSSSSSDKDQITVLLDGKEIMKVNEYNTLQVKPGEFVRGNTVTYGDYTGNISGTYRGLTTSDGKNQASIVLTKITNPINSANTKWLLLTYNQELLTGLMDSDFTEKINGNRITGTYFGTLKPSGKRVEIRVKDVIFTKIYF